MVACHPKILCGYSDITCISNAIYAKTGVLSYNLQEIIDSNPAVPDIPIIANVDFGHTTPMMTFPIGGICKLDVSENQVYMEFPVH